MKRKWWGLLFLLLTQNLVANTLLRKQGTLQIIVADHFKKGITKTKYFLNTSGRKATNLIELKFKDQKPSLVTGQRIEVECTLKKDICGVKSFKNLPNPDGAKTTKKGALKTLWMIVDVTDSTVGLTTDEVKAKMDMTDNWFKDASFNQLKVNKDVDNNGAYDVYRVTLSNYSRAANGCNTNLIRSLALDEVEKQGGDIYLYKHDMLVLPPLGCGWGGLAHVGCNTYCAAWIQSVNWNLVYVHELGHNILMRHASTDPENDGIVNSEYGDASCPMGNQLSKGYFNAPHSNQMGWINNTNGHLDWIENKAGEYSLPSYGEGKGQPLVYRFTTDKRYYLSYRRKGSFDQVKDKYTKGVTLHYLVPTGKTRYIKTLAPGEEYYHDTFQIKSLVADNDSTQFRVELCNLKPELTVDKSYSFVNPGEQAKVDFTVTYPEDTSCAPVEYTLKSVTPGLRSVLSEENITLNPGETKVVSMSFAATEAREYLLSLEAITNKTGSSSSLEAKVLASYGDNDFEPMIHSYRYSGTWDKLPNFKEISSDNSSLVENFTLGEHSGQDNFALRFEGFLYLAPGNYTFSLDSDAGSRFLIDNVEIINYDGLHSKGNPKTSNMIIDTARFYKVDLEYFDKSGSDFLELLMSKDGSELVPIDSSLLFNFVPKEPDPIVTVAAYTHADVTHVAKEYLVPHCFENPVFFAKPMTVRGEDPGVIQGKFKGCTENNESIIELKFKEFEYLDGIHTKEKVALLVADEGNYILEDDSHLAITRLANVKHNKWSSYPLNSKSVVPIFDYCLTQVQSSLESHTRVIRMRKSNNIEQFRLQAEEKLTNDGISSQSDIAVLKLTKTNQLFFRVLSINIDHNWKEYSFTGGTNIYNSTYFTDMTTMNGWDTSYSAVHRVKDFTLKFRAQEEQSKDEELNHAEEITSVIYLMGKSGVLKGRTTVPSVMGRTTVPLK